MTTHSDSAKDSAKDSAQSVPAASANSATAATNESNPPATPPKKMPSPLDCLGGSGVSGAIALGAAALTRNIAQTFAAHPIHSTNRLTLSIGTAVRTLVVGVGALGTFVFGFVAVGLIALAIQLLIKGLIKGQPGDRPTDA
jgi:hypothetical protein